MKLRVYMIDTKDMKAEAYIKFDESEQEELFKHYLGTDWVDIQFPKNK